MGLDVSQKLSLIARNAYGSGVTEKTKGGEGNIGLLGGKVVKFNTHWKERDGTVTDAMRKSSDDLRTELYALSRSFLQNTDPKDSQSILAEIRNKLGLNDDGTTAESRSLLDRKTVATVIRKLEATTKRDLFHMALPNDPEHGKGRVDLGRFASTNKSTRFADATKEIVHKMAKDYLASHGADLNRTLDEMLTDEQIETMLPTDASIEGAQRAALVFEKRTALRSLVRNSVELALADHGEVSAEILSAPGSTLHVLKGFADTKQLTPVVLTFARSLPPREANAFLRARALFRIEGLTFGLNERLHAVASKLAQLSPKEFTPANVLKLAAPDVSVPRNLVRKQPLDDTDMGTIFKTYADFIEDNATAGFVSPKYSQISTMVERGMSLADIKACLKKGKAFSMGMLPPAALFSAGEQQFDVGLAMESFKKDFGRSTPHVTILGSGRPFEVDGKDISNGQDPTEALRDKIRELCGENNKAQQAQIILAMTQNQGTGELLAHLLDGDGVTDVKNVSFTLQKDIRTGDVVMTRRSGLDPNHPEASLTTTVRFRPDGTQAILSSEIRKADLAGVESVASDPKEVKFQTNLNQLIDQMADDILEARRLAQEKYPNGMAENDNVYVRGSPVSKAQIASYAQLGKTKKEICAKLKEEYVKVAKDEHKPREKVLRSLLTGEYGSDISDHVLGGLPQDIENSMQIFIKASKNYGNLKVGLAHDFFRASDGGGILIHAKVNGKPLIDLRGQKFTQEFRDTPTFTEKFGTEEHFVPMNTGISQIVVLKDDGSPQEKQDTRNVRDCNLGRVIQELMTSLPDNADGYENTMLYLTTMLSLSNSMGGVAIPYMAKGFDNGFGTGMGSEMALTRQLNDFFGSCQPSDVATDIRINKETMRVEVVQTGMTQQCRFSGFKTTVPGIALHPMQVEIKMSFPLKKDSESVDANGQPLVLGKLPQGFQSEMTLTPIKTGKGGFMDWPQDE